MKQIEFTIQPLLERKNGKISGPMSPCLAAKEMMNQLGERWNRLARVHFNNPEFHNIYEGPRKTELTGHDTLLIGEAFEDGTMALKMIVDCGTHGTPAAIWFSDENEVTVTQIYKNSKYEKRLTDAEILTIMKQAFESGAMDVVDADVKFVESKDEQITL